MASPHDVRFRLRFLEACGMLPPRTGAVGGVRHGRGSDEISARASGGGSPEFRSRRSDGGDGKSGESGRAAGGVVGFFGRRSTRMAREKIVTTGRKTTRTSDGEGQPKKKARAEMPGGGCSGGAITIRPWSFRGRRSRPCRPRGCTSRPRVSYACASGAWSTAATMRVRIAREEERKTTRIRQ